MTASPDVLEVVPAGPISGELRAPPSKSVSNRLLVIAALADGTSILRDVLESDDTEAMTTGLAALGAGIEARATARPPGGARTVQVIGRAGRLQQPTEVIDSRLSGTTLRFLTALALLVRGTVTLDGAGPLRRRPLAPLLKALTDLGADVASDGGHPPITITSSGLRGGRIHVDARSSSQFVSALLLVAPYLEGGIEITASGLGAAGYLDLTLEVMRRWGAEGQRQERMSYVVEGGRTYRAREDVVEFDASAAAHLFALAMATGGTVTVKNGGPSLQPDGRITEVFQRMGARVQCDADGVTVAAPGSLEGVAVDVSAMPDQLPTLGVLGALASGTTRLSNAGVTRGHETDRLAATAAELSRLGVVVEVDGDALVVRGGGRLHGAEVVTYDDHRMAMAFAAIGAVVPGVRIRDPGCVRKTYPGFWSDAAAIGLALRYQHG